MPTINPNSTQRQPYKLHPALVALFAGFTILQSVLYTELTAEPKADPVRNREIARRDLKDVLDFLRNE